MHTKRNKQKKVYEKPAYQTEEILEKMSLACEVQSGTVCKVARNLCKNPGVLAT